MLSGIVGSLIMRIKISIPISWDSVHIYVSIGLLGFEELPDLGDDDPELVPQLLGLMTV
jgi:hypothetical protein